MLAATTIKQYCDTTASLANTFTNLYNQVALGGTPPTFINSVSNQTGLALSIAYYNANSNTYIAGTFNATMDYLVAFGQNIATASASAQTRQGSSSISLREVYKSLKADDYAVNIDSHMESVIEGATFISFLFTFAQASFQFFSSQKDPLNLGAILTQRLFIAPTAVVPFTSANMFTSGYAAAFAFANIIPYTTQATNYTNAGNYQASPATNVANFASAFAKQAATVLTAVANYSGAAPANYKEAAYAAAYAELFLSGIAQAASTGIPFISYANVNAAIAAGITASSSSTAATILDATKDAVASASQIMATNLGYNYVDVSQIGLFALEALAYSNPQQFLSNLRALGLTPAALVSFAEFFAVKNFVDEKQKNNVAQTNDQALAWLFAEAAIIEQQAANNTLTINGSLTIAGNTLTIDVAMLSDISIPSGGSVTFTTPMTIALYVNGVLTPINVTGLTVVNSGANNSLAVTGSLTLNAAASGTYLNLLEPTAALTISDTFICDGTSLGNIFNLGTITVTNNITMNHNASASSYAINNTAIGTITSTSGSITMNDNDNSSASYGNESIHNEGTILSTSSTVTMNNNIGAAGAYAINLGSSCTLSSQGNITMNNNTTGGSGSGVNIDGGAAIKTNGTFNFSGNTSGIQGLFAGAVITHLNSSPLSFPQFQFTINGTLFGGTYAQLQAFHPSFITLQAANQA